MERTKEDFIEVMKDKTDETLLAIVEKYSSDYSPEAIAAAKEVLTGRGVKYEEAKPSTYQPSCFAEKYYEDNKRFSEYLIDYILIYAISFLLGVLLAKIGLEISTILLDLSGFILTFLYYFIMESACGKTVGKMFLGLKVVDKDGNQPSIARIALRSLCRLVPFDAFSFIFGRGWEKDRLTGNWHDQWSETYVVNMKKVVADVDRK